MEPVNEHNNFIYFTTALIVLLIASAVVDTLPDGDGHFIVRLLILVTQLVALFSLNFGPQWRRFVITMVLLVILTNTLGELTDWPLAPLAALTVALVFFLGMAYGAARRVLFSGVVEVNTVVGAIAVYLLLGLIWAILYLMTLEFYPDAFNGIEHIHWADNFSNALYFSYVTMTSLGYGDISPALTVSRTLAYLQAIAGTFYMAVVVASLIGARTTHRKS